MWPKGRRVRVRGGKEICMGRECRQGGGGGGAKEGNYREFMLKGITLSSLGGVFVKYVCGYEHDNNAF